MRLSMIIRLALGSLIGLLVLGACQETREVQYLMEVTREVVVTRLVVVSATPDDATATPESTPQITPTPTPGAQAAEATPEIVPTPLSEPIIVAEQVFENGRMFYLQPIDEVWVMINTTPDGDQGTWTIYEDTWEEGMPEFDPNIQPPDGFVQPIRGFGKLWRENQAIREALGWALDTEFGHWTNYEYIFGGEVNSAGEYVPGPGQHMLGSREGQTYVFEEVDGTWREVEQTG